MSVLGYLEQRATEGVLSGSENESILKSIATLKTRLNSYFNNISGHFQFGSSTRATILPRSMDSHSDIDYMVVFNDRGNNPQAYLDRLRKFVEYYYYNSEIYQSSPTIVLELNHIRFELVPALKVQYSSGYEIPNGTQSWQMTDPNEFNSKLTNKNTSEKSLIKPTIRMAKFWNAQNGYVYGSYLFERWIVEQEFYQCNNLKEYIFKVFDMLGSSANDAQWRKDKLQRAKNIISRVRELETSGFPVSAEKEIKNLIPA